MFALRQRARLLSHSCVRAWRRGYDIMEMACAFEYHQTPVPHFKFPWLPFSPAFLETVPNLLNQPVRHLTIGVPKSYSIGFPILETLPDYIPGKNALHIPIPPLQHWLRQTWREAPWPFVHVSGLHKVYADFIVHEWTKMGLMVGQWVVNESCVSIWAMHRRSNEAQSLLMLLRGGGEVRATTQLLVALTISSRSFITKDPLENIPRSLYSDLRS